MNKEDELPAEMMSKIVERLDFEDYMRLSATSNSFRDFVKQGKYYSYKKPWMMLANKPGEKSRIFYSPFEGKFYNLKLPKIVIRSACCGSCDGWLIFAHKTRGNFMYNPITRKRLPLPTYQVEHKYHRPENFTSTNHIKRSPYFLKKAVFSSPSSTVASTPTPTPRFVVAAIAYNYQILVSFCSPLPIDNNDNNNWHQFNRTTFREEEGLLSPILCDMELIIEERNDEEVYEGIEEEEYEGYNPNYDEEEEEKAKEGEKGEKEIRIYKWAGNSKVITDIIFYKGEFYVLNKDCKIIVLTVDEDNRFSFRKLSICPLKIKWKECFQNNIHSLYYLVESCHGDLLLVLRMKVLYELVSIPSRYGEIIEETKNFLVFKLDESRGEPFRWVRVKNLGDQVLFLGKNHSKSMSSCDVRIPARRQEEETKVVGNCIYFTDDVNQYAIYDLYQANPYKDSGVFHLDDERIENVLPSELPKHHIYSLRGQPIWFTPTPW